MEGLEAALERARRACADELEMMRVRQLAARDRNRLRKVSLTSMVSGRADEMLSELDLWGIPRPRTVDEAERAKFRLLARLAQTQAGSPGNAEWRVAGYELLRFWIESGRPVTATKLDMKEGAAGELGAGDNGGLAFAPSPAVAFLAEQLPKIDPSLARTDPARPGWTPALDAAYTITRAWLDAELPHWTMLDPQPPHKPGGNG